MLMDIMLFCDQSLDKRGEREKKKGGGGRKTNVLCPAPPRGSLHKKREAPPSRVPAPMERRGGEGKKRPAGEQSQTATSNDSRRFLCQPAAHKTHGKNKKSQQTPGPPDFWPMGGGVPLNLSQILLLNTEKSMRGGGEKRTSKTVPNHSWHLKDHW